MIRAVLLLVLALSAPAQSTVPVTIAWALDPTHTGATWELERNGTVQACGSVQVTATDRRCTAQMPLGPATIRLRGTVVSGGKPLVGAWSTPITETIAGPGILTIVSHREDSHRMAIALVTSTSARNTDTNTATSGSINTTGSTLLVMVLSTYALGTEPTPTDSKSNIWTPLSEEVYTSLVRIRIWYVANPTVGSGHTFQASGSVVYPTLIVGAFSGVTVSSPFDGTEDTNQSTATTSIQPGSITPSQANAVVITGLSTDDGSSAYQIDGGYSIIASETPNSLNWGTSMAYLVQTSAAATNPTWSWTGNVRITTAIAAFRIGAQSISPAQGPAAFTGNGVSMGFRINMPDEL